MRAAVLLIALAAACGSRPHRAATVKPALPALGAPARPRAIPKRTSDVEVAVTGTRVTINGARIGGRPMVADIVGVLGMPDRTWTRDGAANRVHTWDELGVVVYEPHDGRCVSIAFPYKPMPQDFNPAHLFGGTIVLDGRRLAPSLSLATVKTWPRASTPYTARSIVFDLGDVHVFTIEERPPTGKLDLVELSFWNRRAPGDPGEVASRSAGGGVAQLELACEDGDASACTRLALVLQTGNAPHPPGKDPERSFRFARLGCEHGDAFACTMLGNMYEAGRGIEASRAQALEAWRRACTLGDPVGCDRATPSVTRSSSSRGR